MQDDDDVTSTEDGLFVGGVLFAYLEANTLVVQLPFKRVIDLLTRAVAEPVRRAAPKGNGWAKIPDPTLWPELSREAHIRVGENAVGGQS